MVKTQTFLFQVVDSVHGILFDPSQPDTLDRALSLLIEDKKLSNFAKSVASHGKLLSINMLASECIVSYAQLLENVLHFPSDTLIPYSSSPNQQKTWLWDLLDREIKQTSTSMQVSSSSKDKDYIPRSSIVHQLEEEYSRRNLGKGFQVENMTYDFPNESDWNIVNEMQVFEDYDCRETQEVLFHSCNFHAFPQSLAEKIMLKPDCEISVFLLGF